MPVSLGLDHNLIENHTFLDTSGWIPWDSLLDVDPGWLRMQQWAGSNDFGAWTIFEDVRPGVEHSWSAEVFLPLAQEAYIWIGYYEGEHTEPSSFLNLELGTEFEGEGDWLLISGTFTPPPGTRSIEWGPFWGNYANSIPSVFGDQMHLRNPVVSRADVKPQLFLDRSLTPNPNLDVDVSDWDVRRGTKEWDQSGALKITSTVAAGQTTTALPEAADPVLLPGWSRILFPLIPGETYSFSFRSKSPLGKLMFVYNAYAIPDGNETAEHYQQVFVGTGDWQTIEGSYTVPETVSGGLVPVGGYFAIGMDSPDNAVGKVWRLDDLVFDRVNPILDFAPDSLPQLTLNPL